MIHGKAESRMSLFSSRKTDHLIPLQVVLVIIQLLMDYCITITAIQCKFLQGASRTSIKLRKGMHRILHKRQTFVLDLVPTMSQLMIQTTASAVSTCNVRPFHRSTALWTNLLKSSQHGTQMEHSPKICVVS